MKTMAKKKRKTELVTNDGHYSDILASMVDLLESARRASARAVIAELEKTQRQFARRSADAARQLPKAIKNSAGKGTKKTAKMTRKKSSRR
jgi:hypothetical protein